MLEKGAFVICPIGDPETETRRRSDQVYNHIVSPALAERDYKPLRADKMAEPGLITSQIIQQVVESPLVIADLSEQNPNVFYELAIRHATGKPYIQLIRKGEQIPFDVAGTRTIVFDTTDPDSVLNARCEIVDQIDSIEKKKDKIESPLSISLDLQQLKERGNPEARTLADVMNRIT